MVPIYIDIPTADEYWGNTANPEQAQRAADALMTILCEAAKQMNIEAEITQSHRGDSVPSDSIPDSEEQRRLNSICEFSWDHDVVQTAAFEGGPIDVNRVLRDYNDDIVRRGGKRCSEFDSRTRK